MRETNGVECSKCGKKPMERMGVRARSNNNHLLKGEEEDHVAAKLTGGQKGALITKILWRELGEFRRAAIRLAKGEGSAVAYVLLLPGAVCALWMLVAFLTSSAKKPDCHNFHPDIDEEELRVAIEKVGINTNIIPFITILQYRYRLKSKPVLVGNIPAKVQAT